MSELAAFLDTHRQRYLDELCALLRIPSVSARSEHDADTIACAEFVAERLRGAGMRDVTVHSTDDCEDDQLCVNAACEQACESAAECGGDGWICRLGYCAQDPEVECRTDSECAAGSTCVSGDCTAAP